MPFMQKNLWDGGNDSWILGESHLQAEANQKNSGRRGLIKGGLTFFFSSLFLSQFFLLEKLDFQLLKAVTQPRRIAAISLAQRRAAKPVLSSFVKANIGLVRLTIVFVEKIIRHAKKTNVRALLIDAFLKRLWL